MVGGWQVLFIRVRLGQRVYDKSIENQLISILISKHFDKKRPSSFI